MAVFDELDTGVKSNQGVYSVLVKLGKISIEGFQVTKRSILFYQVYPDRFEMRFQGVTRME